MSTDAGDDPSEEPTAGWKVTTPDGVIFEAVETALETGGKDALGGGAPPMAVLGELPDKHAISESQLCKRLRDLAETDDRLERVSGVDPETHRARWSYRVRTDG